MLKRLSIAQKIYASFGAMILLLVVLVVSAYLGVSNLTRIFNDYRSESQQTLAIAGFVDNLAAARLADQQFRRNPSGETSALLAERIDALRVDDPEVMAAFADSAAYEILGGLGQNAIDYSSAFERMAASQADIDSLVAELTAMGLAIRTNAAEALQSAASSANFHATTAAGFAVQEVMLTQVNIESFLLSNDTALYELAEGHAENATGRLETLISSIFATAQKAHAQALHDAVQDYRAQMVRVRDTILARNVVIAEELDVLGPQMQAGYDQMLDSVRTQQEELGAQGAMQSAQTSLLVAGLGVGSLIIGGLLAFFIGRWLSGSIRKVAGDMRQLAEGNLDLDLDDHQRHEIGQMIEALAVFRDNGKAMRAMDAEKEEAQRRDAAENAIRQDLQNEISQVVAAAVAGDFSVRIDKHFNRAELDDLAGSVNTLIDTVDRGLTETGSVLSAMAEDDLSKRMTGDYQGAFDKLKTDTNEVAERFSDVVGRLQQTSRALKVATGEILSGANDLSERTTRQAATIEETAATMDQLAGTVTENAKKAETVASKAEDASTMASQGGAVMDEANRAMQRITQSSEKISNIIGMIDDIAFQTNLLALNASVEAARAGEAGKGFAVVAVEVRRLAQSAAQASAEVKALIEQSTSEVGSGSKLVSEAATKLQAILVAVKENAQVMTEISAASRDQAASIAEVSAAVRQLDEMTQHNAALVEETNAAIEQTETQATELDTIADIFDLDGSRPRDDLEAFEDDMADDGEWDAGLAATR